MRAHINAVRIAPLSPELRPAFERLLPSIAALSPAWRVYWQRTSIDDIVNWLFYARPAAQTWVLMDGNRCVGLLDSCVCGYLLDGARVAVREPALWFCLPEYRTGFGLELLLHAMRSDEPLIVSGGVRNSWELLQKLRWTIGPTAEDYVLPVTLRGLATNLIRQLCWQRERLGRFLPDWTIKRIRKAAPPASPSVQSMEPSSRVDPPIGQGAGLTQIIAQERWRWLSAMPAELGVPIGLSYETGEGLIGRSVVRLEPGLNGMNGRLLHMEWRDPAAAGWIVNEAVRVLVERGAGFITCRVSTPAKARVLKSSGFLLAGSAPIHWFSRSIRCPLHVDIGYLQHDNVIPWTALRSRQLGMA